MEYIETTMFAEPSGNVRGVAVAIVPISRKRGKKIVKENVRIAHASLLTDESPAISLNLSGGAKAEDLAVISTAMSNLLATVAKLDEDRIGAE